MTVGVQAQPYALTIEENTDRSWVFKLYPNGTSAGTLFDFTGYSASMMIRVNVNDASPVMTLTPVLGGAAGTLTITITATQANTLVGLLPNLTGFYDVLLTAPGADKYHFITISTLTIIRSVTR